MLKKSYIWLFLILASAIVSTSFFLMTSPISLQKILSLKIVNSSSPLYSQEFSEFEAQDVANFIGSIPYRSNPTISWFVDPELMFNDTILNGNGNCSNLVLGAVYAFINSHKQAAIVHLLEKDYGFLRGVGHTVLSINLENQSIVLDILEGGFPLQNNNPINILNFDYKQEDIFSHRVLNDRKDIHNEYFRNAYLQKIEIGLVPQNEIVHYLNFLEKFYFSLGHRYTEKLVFDGLALMFGYYPNTYVDENFFWMTYSDNKLEVLFSYMFLASFHLLYIILLLLLAQFVLSAFKEKKKL